MGDREGYSNAQLRGVSSKLEGCDDGATVVVTARMLSSLIDEVLESRGMNDVASNCSIVALGADEEPEVMGDTDGDVN